MVHLNATNCIPGYAMCGAEGFVTNHESGVTCPKCVKFVEAEEMKRILRAMANERNDSCKWTRQNS